MSPLLKDDELELATFGTISDDYEPDYNDYSTLTIDSKGQCRFHDMKIYRDNSYKEEVHETEPSVGAGWMMDLQCINECTTGMDFDSHFMKAYLYMMYEADLIGDVNIKKDVMGAGVEVATLQDASHKALDYETLVIGKNNACQLRYLHISLEDKAKEEKAVFISTVEAVEWMMENQQRANFVFCSDFWKLYCNDMIQARSDMLRKRIAKYKEQDKEIQEEYMNPDIPEVSDILPFAPDMPF